MMNRHIKRILHRFSRKKKIVVDRRLFVFLFFLIISTISWLLTALSKSYTTDILYPIRYIELPKGKVLIGDLPPRLTLTIEAHGFTLLGYKAQTLLPINFSVKSFMQNEMSEADDTTNFYILSSIALKNISGQINSEIKIKDISPDTIFFNLVKVITKKVPVKLNAKIIYDKQFMLLGKDIKIVPDSIEISGPYNQIDKINSVKTKYVEFTKISKSISTNLSLEKINNIKFSKYDIKVEIPIEKYTEADLKVKIKVINAPYKHSLKTFPNYITVSYYTGLSKYYNIKSHLFKAIVDYKSIQLNNDQHQLNVRLIDAPYDSIKPKSLKYYPKVVDYIIEKR